jgi:hypothetical protein
VFCSIVVDVCMIDSMLDPTHVPLVELVSVMLTVPSNETSKSAQLRGGMGKNSLQINYQFLHGALKRNCAEFL